MLLTCQAGFESLLARELAELHGVEVAEQGPGWALAHAAATQAEYLVYQPNSGGFTVNLSATAR